MSWLTVLEWTKTNRKNYFTELGQALIKNDSAHGLIKNGPALNHVGPMDLFGGLYIKYLLKYNTNHGLTYPTLNHVWLSSQS